MRKLIGGGVGAVAMGIMSVGVASAAAASAAPPTEPEPDRVAVEASFRQAFTEQFGAEPLLSSCGIGATGMGGYIVRCWAQTAEFVVYWGIAPNRAPVNGPFIDDPMAWTWDIKEADSPTAAGADEDDLGSGMTVLTAERLQAHVDAGFADEVCTRYRDTRPLLPADAVFGEVMDAFAIVQLEADQIRLDNGGRTRFIEWLHANCV